MRANKAILCVDDEAIILLSMKAELKNHFGRQFLYETALNAEEALDALAQLAQEGVTVILVLSDWLMPGMQGDEFLALVKERYPRIKTLLITGNADRETIDRIKRAGVANDIIRKPWSNIDLIARVEACLE